MMLKLIILLLFMLAPSFGMDVQPTGLKSEFSVKCFGIMQPLLQDIAVKKLKIDQCDETIQNKTDQILDIQHKYDQLQIKLAVSEAVVREKDRQIVDQHDLYISHKNNSLVKDELLKTYRIQVSSNEEIIQTKANQIEKLLKEARDNGEKLEKCKLKTEQLENLDKSNQLQKKENEEQIKDLTAELKENKEQADKYKNNLQRKTERFKKLEAEWQWNGVKFEELKSNLTNKEQEIKTLQTENQKLSDQLSTYKLQVETADIQLEAKTTTLNAKQTEIDQLQQDLTTANTKLSDYQSEIDKMQSTNCFWFGNSSDIHKIRAPGISPFEVLCNSHLAGPGWTVIQRRINGSENFYRNWTDYRDGFGSLHGEFFMGMEKLYRLTIGQSYELYIHLETFNNESYHARYADFSIGSESEGYALKMLGTYTGTAGDGLYYARNRKFTTFDVDNDRDEHNCAVQKHGAWWYDRCGLSNLNGLYMTEPTKDLRSIFWFGAHAYSYKSVQMMLRPKSAEYNFKL